MASIPSQNPCTLDYLTSVAPCMECLSVSQLEAILIIILGAILGIESDVDAELAATVEFVALSKKQQLEAVIAALGSTLEQLTPADAMELSKCWYCANPAQRRAVLVSYLCQLGELRVNPAN